MRLDSLLLPRQDSGGDCIESCPEPTPCNCNPNQDCVIINRDCHTCSTTTCIAKKGASKSAAGVSKGALAGGSIGAIVFFALSISMFLWYRRKSRLRKIIAKGRDTHAQKDKPLPVQDVLNRPDPIEKLPVAAPQQAPNAPATIPDPESHGTTLPLPLRPQLINPFDDANSIQTTRTEGTNAIPIALVSPDYRRSKTDTDTLPSTTSSGPLRPLRSPDMNLEHVNVSHENLRVPYAGSTVSGISNMSRNSYMSNVSYASDILHEAPVIVTPNSGAVRQVLNVVKAEVVNTAPISPPSDGLKPPPFLSRPNITSPLAATSFGPNDVLNEADEGHETIDPFADTHSTTAQGSTSPAAKTFDQASYSESVDSKWVPDGPSLPWARSEDSRPSSISTQEGSVINIGSATRVNVGLSSLASPATVTSVGRSTYRTTMGRLVSPQSSGSSPSGTLQEQQARALAHAQAQAQGSKRISGSSVVSAASTRADSILEAFPFVPPSPISDRPLRSPPVSPLIKQSFAASPSTLAQPTVTIAPPSPLNQQVFNANSPPSDNDALPAPPSRHTLGLSTGSQLSTTSTGLGSFPFHIDSGATGDANTSSRPNTLIRQRASLDTLALTSDLASYPLDFERDSMPLAPQRKI